MNKLIVQAGAGLAFLLIVLGAILFLFAGSLDYWQAWVYLADFGICTLLVTIWLYRYDQRLLQARTQAGPVAETQRSQQIIQGFASLFFIALYVVPGLDHRNHWTSVPLVVTIVSYAGVALGFYFVFLVFQANSFTSGTIEVAAGQKVVTTGPYAVVRHPMYAGAGLMLLFTSPALGSWLGIPLALLMMVVIGLRAVEEEKFLRTSLAGYDEYLQKVRYRLIPYVW